MSGGLCQSSSYDGSFHSSRDHFDPTQFVDASDTECTEPNRGTRSTCGSGPRDVTRWAGRAWVAQLPRSEKSRQID